MLIALWIIIFLCLASIIKGSIRYKISPAVSGVVIQNEVIMWLNKETDLKKIIDLGAGFGFFSLKLARRFPNITVVSYEVQTIPFFVMVFLKKIFLQKNWIIYKQDFFKLKSLDACYIYCYLYADSEGKITRFLKDTISRNTKVISSTFALGLNLQHKIKVFDIYQTPIYVYFD